MKAIIACFVALSMAALTAQAADVSVKLTEVHLCCKSCVNIAQKTAEKVPGSTIVADQEEDTITVTAADTATVQKAVDALVAGGYFGKSSNPDIKVVSDTGAKGEMVTTLDVSNVHLCCPKCVKAVNEILSTVPGYTTNNAVKNAKTFTVTGNFKDSDVFAALQKGGLTGKAGKP